MTRIVVATAVAALLFAAASGTSQAVPIAPLTGIDSADEVGVTPVYWHRHHYYHHRYYHHRYYHRGYYHRGYYHHRHWRRW
jgi:hypothetical protein